jgi:hypothetical protein
MLSSANRLDSEDVDR